MKSAMLVSALASLPPDLRPIERYQSYPADDEIVEQAHSLVVHRYHSFDEVFSWDDLQEMLAAYGWVVMDQISAGL